MGGLHFDDHELRELILDLSEAPQRVQRRAPQVLRDKIRPRLQAEVKVDSAGHMGNWFGDPLTSYETPLAGHVSSEMHGKWEIEAGIESKGAGKLAHIIADGSVNNAPAYDAGASLRRTMPYAMDELAAAGEESVLGTSGSENDR